MLWRLAPATLLFLALAPPVAHAQVNIDQAKSPAHIFASDCSVCHKSTRGLANGRGGSSLAGFLTEHYTSSKEEAAAMAAYVLAAGGGLGSPAPARQQNGMAERPSAESPKADGRRRSTKPERAESAKPKPAVTERGKPRREQRNANAEPGQGGAEPKPQDERHPPSAVAPKSEESKPAEADQPKSQAAAAAAPPTPAAPAKPATEPPSPAPSADPHAVQPSATAPGARDSIAD